MTASDGASKSDIQAASSVGATQRPQTPPSPAPRQSRQSANGHHASSDENNTSDEEDEDEDTEPKLKYSKLTGSLGPIYRNGDATSSCSLAGDKLITGTHNGNVHVLSIPSFQILRTYKAHTASVTALSISPFPPPWPTSTSEEAVQIAVASSGSASQPSTPSRGNASSPRAPKPQPQIPSTPSNSIYIASASIDGNVCVSSLVDPKDVLLRNFARPIQAVALSTEYKYDRSYLSGGLAGQLILTSGGKTGVRTNANTNSVAVAASGWLGSIGLGANTGTDTVLHSGEGSISTIKWSLTGRFVLWVNEQGIKLMRTNTKLGSEELEHAWERIGHIDKPNRKVWEEMANVWKARAEWVEDDRLEVDDNDGTASGDTSARPRQSRNASESLAKLAPVGHKAKLKSPEKAVVGWGDTAWVIHVKPDGGRHRIGSADIVHKLLFDDCIISGISLYSPSLMLILAYRIPDEADKPPESKSATSSPRRGVQHRQSGVQPELRLIEASSGSEVDVDTLTVSRFESLAAADYHLSTLYVPPVAIGSLPKGALETLSTGLWDVTVSAGRIFSSGASVLSMPLGGEKVRSAASVNSSGSGVLSPRVAKRLPFPAAASAGLKIFVSSPYDCVLAVKREPSDHLEWLLQHEQFEEAYNLISAQPAVVSSLSSHAVEIAEPRAAGPANRAQSLVDFLADSASVTSTGSGAQHGNGLHARFSAAEKEKLNIADRWLEKLTTDGAWNDAARVAGRTLGSSQRWEHWTLSFAQAKQLDAVTPFVPPTEEDTQQEKLPLPPLPGLVYEVILGHYIATDRKKFHELFARWDPAIIQYEVSSVASTIESKLRDRDFEGGVQEGSTDWTILMEALGRLYFVDGRMKEALKTWVRCHNATEAIKLLKDYSLLGELSDDIRGFLTLRLNDEQLRKDQVDIEELAEASQETMEILIDEAYTGVVPPRVVVEQLEGGGDTLRPLLYLYIRALWTGDLSGKATKPKRGTMRGRERLLVDGRIMVEEFGDLAVKFFAEYDRDVLMQFLRNSQSYAFETASSICEAKGYTTELVYLLSKTGQTRRALSLITTKIDDPSLAISFVKEQNDPELWDDLLDYSMDKPRFIRALLNEVGTSIDPITLVKRIPEGLEIEGLRDGIGRMVKEFEIQGSISEGVARVLRGEVTAGQQVLREGRRKAVKFEVVREASVVPDDSRGATSGPENAERKAADGSGELVGNAVQSHAKIRLGICGGCGEVFKQAETESLIGFACGHVFHLSCLLTRNREQACGNTTTTAGTDGDGARDAALAVAEELQQRLVRDTGAADETGGIGTFSRSVGAKTARGRIIGSVVGKVGCPLCVPDDDDLGGNGG